MKRLPRGGAYAIVSGYFKGAPKHVEITEIPDAFGYVRVYALNPSWLLFTHVDFCKPLTKLARDLLAVRP